MPEPPVKRSHSVLELQPLLAGMLLEEALLLHHVSGR